MSKKDPKTPESQMFAEDVRARERRRRVEVPFWQILSFVLHGAAFVALVLFTPLREIIIPEPKVRDSVKMSADRLEKLSENLQTVRLNELLDQLSSLQIILHNMDMMKNEMMQDYDAFAENEQLTAKESIAEVLEKIISGQTQVVENQKKTLDSVSTIAKLQSQNIADTNITTKIREVYQEAEPSFFVIDAAQAAAQNLLDKVAVDAELVGLVKTEEALRVVRDVQLKANTLQRESQKNLENKVNALTSYPKLVKSIPDLKTALQKNEDNLKTAEEKIIAQKRDAERYAKEAEALAKEIAQKVAQEEKAKAEAEAAKTKASELSKTLAATREALAALVKEKPSVDAAARDAAAAHTTAKKEAAKSEASPEAIAKVAEVQKEAEEKQAKADEMVEQKQALTAAEKQGLAVVLEARDQEKAAAQQLRAAENETRKTQNSLKETTRMAETNAKGAERDEKWREQIKASIEKSTSEIAAAEVRKLEIEKLAKLPASEIQSGQKDSITAQEALITKVKEIAELAKLEEADLKKIAQETYVPNPITQKSFEQLDIVEAYDAAKLLEEKITESYREIKSAEVAMLRKMSFSAAEKMTDVAKTVRPDADAELLKSAPRDKETFDKQKEAAVEVVREADNMVETTKMLMTAAIEIVKPEVDKGHQEEDAGDRLQRMYDLANLNQKLTEGAAEDESERAKDLSQLMAQTSKAESATSMPKVETKMDEEALKMEQGRLSALKSPNPTGVPSLTSKTPDIFPGNIIQLGDSGAGQASGIPTQWMYVNSWYVIGPFPNPDRVNLRRRFAPESVVDLEATYIGKNEKPVKWEFEQARSSARYLDGRALVIPRTSEEYGIWYAYSELFVDQECDLWLAVGSDDRSDIWLNDMHIWGSSNELKSWSINEGFRKVHFQKGRNRFLVRVENGWHAISWSVSVALTDDVAL